MYIIIKTKNNVEAGEFIWRLKGKGTCYGERLDDDGNLEIRLSLEYIGLVSDLLEKFGKQLIAG